VIRLTVNGKPREVEGDARLPLPQLLVAFEVNPKLVAVAINGDVIPKSDYDAAIVSDGDELEIVRMVGGGAPGRMP
jgi:thiamine biosynthesis protein ThiS